MDYKVLNLLTRTNIVVDDDVGQRVVPAEYISDVGKALEDERRLRALHGGLSMQRGGEIIYGCPSGKSNLRRLAPSGKNTEGREVDAVGNAVFDAEDGLPAELKADPDGGEEFELSYNKSQD